jgi:hypothetical protein
MYINNFNDFITESVKIHGKMNENIRLIYEEFTRILVNKLFGDEKIKITLSFS